MISIVSEPCVANSRRALMAAALLSAMVVVGPTATRAADSEQQQLVEKAKLTLDAFAADPGLRSVIRELKGPKPCSSCRSSCGVHSYSVAPAAAAC